MANNSIVDKLKDKLREGKEFLKDLSSDTKEFFDDFEFEDVKTFFKDAWNSETNRKILDTLKTLPKKTLKELSKVTKKAIEKGQELSVAGLGIIKDKQEQNRLKKKLNSISFNLTLNHLVLEYIESIKNDNNEFIALSKEQCLELANKTDEFLYADVVAYYIETIYMPSFYETNCKLVDGSKQLYKLI